VREWRVEGPYELRATLLPLQAGPIDPCMRLEDGAVWRATRTPEGPASWRAERTAADRVRLRAWGPGSDWVLDRGEDLLGLSDPPVPAPAAACPAVKRFARRAAGVRLPRMHRVVELLVPSVLAQKVSGKESARAHANLARRFSERAPGPRPDLWLPLSPDALASLPTWATEPLGVLARHLEVLRAIGHLATRLEEAQAMELDEAMRRLTAVPGIGPWTAGRVGLHGMGFADALPLGDLHLPSLVAFNLAGERHADDRRMLELLEPCRGQRGRVLRWIAAAGGRLPPRRAPRLPLRPLPRW